MSKVYYSDFGRDVKCELSPYRVFPDRVDMLSYQSVERSIVLQVVKDKKRCLEKNIESGS